MALTFVQQAEGSTALAPGFILATMTPTAGNLLIAVIQFDDAQVPVLTTSQANSFTLIPAATADTGAGARVKLQTYWAIANGGVTTFTNTVGGSGMCIYVAEYATAGGSVSISGAGNGSFQNGPGVGTDTIVSGLVGSSGSVMLFGFTCNCSFNVSATAGTTPNAFTAHTPVWLARGTVACGISEDALISSNAQATFGISGGGAAEQWVTIAAAFLLTASGGGGGGTTQSMPKNSNFNPQGNTFLVTTNATPSTASAQLVSFNPTLSAQVAAQASGLQNCPPAVCVANLGTAVVYVSFTSALRTAIVPAANPQLELPVFPGVERVFTLPQTPNVGSATPYALQINTISSAASQPLLITFGEQHLT